MRTLLTFCLLVVPTICFSSVIIPGVPTLPLNGGLGSGSLEILGYWTSGHQGLTTSLSADLALFNSYMPLNQHNSVDSITLPTAIESFAADRGYSFSAERTTFFFFSVDDFRSEIDAGRPVAIISDSQQSGFLPYEVAAIGYDTIGDVDLFCYIDRLTNLPIWRPWVEASTAYAWGVESVVTIVPSAAPVPEPATWLLLASGIIALTGTRKFLSS